MYYSPPKSSIWGHSLKNMDPEIQREKFDKFLQSAVKQYTFNSGSVFYMPPIEGPYNSPEFDDHFLTLLNLTEKLPAFSNLDESQFEICYREIIKNPDLYDAGKRGATVTASYVIESWKMNGDSIPTNSRLHIYYGAKSLVIPGFAFHNIEEFEFIKKKFSELEICKLKEKHLKKD